MLRWKCTLVTVFFVSTFVLAWWGRAGAVPFSFQINRFTVIQGVTVLVNDGFDDGLEPPLGPSDSPTCILTNTCTYRVPTNGTFGVNDESGSSLTLNNIGAQNFTFTNGTPGERKGANLRRRINQSSGAFFIEADFAGILPADTQAQFGSREQYRIGLSDRFSNSDDNIALSLRNVGGQAQLRFRDISNQINLGSVLLGSLSPEITLRLDVNASGIVTASFDADGSAGGFAFTPISGSVTIYDGETQTRARFRVLSPIPEPSTMLLLGSGLAGLAFFRWRRKREA